MKRLCLFLVFAVIGFTGNSQIISIPDANFKARLIATGVDTNNDGEIQQSEALSVTGLYLDSSNISSLEGMQNFSNITALWCSYNPLTEINLCGTAVAVLFCNDNQNLTTVNLKNNVISHTVWQEPPFPPFFVDHLPSLQYICADADEMAEAQSYFNQTTTNTITYTSDCNITDCPSLLLHSNQVQDNAISVYPNPASNTLNIQLKENTAIQSIRIYNMLGQLVLANTNKIINVSGLKTGTYFIKIISDKGTASSKFIKE